MSLETAPIILADSRDPKEISQGIKALGVQVQVKALSFGDYSWHKSSGEIRGIERKTLSDLISSLFNKRLESQLAGCIETYDQVTVLLEGPLAETFLGRQITPVHFANLMSSIGEHGIEVVWSPSLAWTPRILVGLYQRDQRPETERKFLRASITKRRPSIVRLDKEVEMLMRVWERLPESAAIKLVKKYGGLWGVLQAKPEALMEYKGIAKRRIKSLYRAVGKTNL